MALIAGTAVGEVLTGTGGDDEIRGLGGADTLDGGDGADTLDGGAGADVLRGGNHRDLFRFAAGDSGINPGSLDTIRDWQSTDGLTFGAAPPGSDRNYIELVASTYETALEIANTQIAFGTADYVVVQIGSDVLVFADSAANDGTADDVVVLAGRMISDISYENFAIPATRPLLPNGVEGAISGNMDTVHLASLLGAEIVVASPPLLRLVGPNASLILGGSGFVYDEDDQLIGGSVSAIDYSASNGFHAALTIRGLSAGVLGEWVADDATGAAFEAIFLNNDLLEGSPVEDLIRGYAGNDTISTGTGADTVFGGLGDDVIIESSGSNYLRGDEGADSLQGGSGFDDLNGNMGSDTAAGGTGDDWVVGGKDDDRLFGDAGHDLVYGNLGNDTCEGGDGNDTVRGGQDDDIVRGGAGADYLSGDRGADTMTGGTGADIFHSFGEAGVDRVTDFTASQGDRVQLDPGTQYTVAQQGADTVISMTGGGQLILVGVQLSSLPTGWLFGA